MLACCCGQAGAPWLMCPCRGRGRQYCTGPPGVVLAAHPGSARRQCSRSVVRGWPGLACARDGRGVVWCQGRAWPGRICVELAGHLPGPGDGTLVVLPVGRRLCLEGW